MLLRFGVAGVAVALVVGIVAAVGGISEAFVSQVVIGVLLGLILIAVAVMTRPERAIPIVCDPFVIQCAFHSQFFIVGPLALILGGYDLSRVAFAYSYGPAAVLKVLAAFALLMAMTAIGYRSRVGWWIAEHLPDSRSGWSRLPGRTWAERLLVLVSLGGCLWWIEYQGGWLQKLSTGYAVGTQTGGAMFRIAFELLLVAVLVVGWRVLNDERRSRALRLGFFGFLFFAVVFYGIISSVRKYVFYVFFGLAFLWIIRRGVRGVPKWLLGAGLGVLLLYFAFWGTVRARSIMELVGQTSSTSVYAGAESIQGGYLASVADPFNVACVAWEVFPTLEPHRHGQTLLVTLLGFIPRAVWPEKPISIGRDITRYFVGPFYRVDQSYSLAVTVMGDLYINFGWFGVLLGGLGLGFVCRVVTQYAVSGMVDGQQLSASRALIPAVFIMGLGELRSDMASMLMFYILTMGPLLALLAVFRYDDGPADLRV